jgi:hypothetical protein
MNSTIKFHLDVDEINREIESFSAELLKVRSKVSQVFISRINALLDAGCVDCEQVPTDGTFDIFLRLKLSNSFSELMAAFRAGDFFVD